jgi:hypothetical protein
MQSHAAWKRLTETFFLSPVVDCMPASKTVPTPKAVARQRRCQRFHAGGGADERDGAGGLSARCFRKQWCVRTPAPSAAEA